MKLSLLLSTIAVPAALADFSVYYIHRTLGDENHLRWAVYDETPRVWKDYDDMRTYRSSNDVSDKKIGFRCWGSGCAENKVSGIEGLEMSLTDEPEYHFTIYKDRGYAMVGLNGEKYADCVITTGDDFHVSHGNHFVHGYQKFRCYNTPITAWHIQNYERP